MPMLIRLSREYAHFSWTLVYTLEAHACNEWPISSARYDPSGTPVQIRQHCTIQERLHAAESFRRAFDIPFNVVTDTMENKFEDLFCTWPFRFYVLHRHTVIFQAQPRDCTYSLEPLVEVLERMGSR
mmetsp:Transcript_76558/g.164164  ORF Transcript_76558/g.164164 Transcript_76558/m.164164 type:complete len:127 (+) Transcript_76558:64-444(+)